jgi:hypothetical protein
MPSFEKIVLHALGVTGPPPPRATLGLNSNRTIMYVTRLRNVYRYGKVDAIEATPEADLGLERLTQ